MAYTGSNLVNAQAKLLQAWQDGVLKYTNPAVYLSILSQSPLFFPNYETLRTREDRTLLAYYIKRASRSLSTGRSEAHSGTVGQSSSLTPSWTTYSDPFAYTLKQANNNVLSLDDMINGEVANTIRNFAEGIETVATAFLFNNKSGVNGCAVDGVFDADVDVFNIALAKEKQLGVIVRTMMQINKYSGNLTIYCDSVLYNKVWNYSNQGAQNAENLSFQFAGVNWVHAVGLYALAAALGYTDGFGLAVQTGLVGVLPHLPKENREGIVTTVNKYGTILNPIDNLDYAIHSFEARIDGTSTGGYTQDVKTQVEISIDLAFEDCPLDTAGETVIQAFGFKESVL